jgi:hypothetical protein
MKTITLSINVFLLLLINICVADGQKLPTKQEKNFTAPSLVIIDGLSAEWGMFQAYNKSTKIFYTIANNQANLYLVVKAVDPEIIRKILFGGLTLTVNQFAKNDNGKSPSISYPLISVENSQVVISALTKGKNENDTSITAINQWITKRSNTFKINNMPGIADTLAIVSEPTLFAKLPLFSQPGYYLINENNDDINVAGKFDNQWAYTAEIKIPLKVLSLTANGKFNYNIRLNGPMYKSNRPTPGVTVTYKYVNGEQVADNQDLLNPTDFWGEYNLNNN